MADTQPNGGRFGWVTDLLGQLPGGSVAQRGIEAVSRLPVEEMASVGRATVEQVRLAGMQALGLGGQLEPKPSSNGEAPTTGSAPPPPEPRTPAEMLGRLLERGASQTAAEAMTETLARIVDQLVADEAKLLASLVGETGQPLVGVEHVTGFGRSESVESVLSNITTAARSASIRSQELLDWYIWHLYELGLVRIGPPAPELEVEYEILEAGAEVRAAVAGILSQGRRHRARVTRQTLQLTELGRALWNSYAEGPPG